MEVFVHRALIITVRPHDYILPLFHTVWERGYMYYLDDIYGERPAAQIMEMNSVHI